MTVRSSPSQASHSPSVARAVTEANRKTPRAPEVESQSKLQALIQRAHRRMLLLGVLTAAIAPTTLTAGCSPNVSCVFQGESNEDCPTYSDTTTVDDGKAPSQGEGNGTSSQMDAGIPTTDSSTDASPISPELINEEVTFPAWKGSLISGTNGSPSTPLTELTARVYKPQGNGPFPAVVFMSGCEGMMTGTNGTLGSQFTGWGERMKGKGIVSFFVDSMTPRGITNGICRTHGEKISEVEERPKDAYAALKQLRTLPYIKDNKIAVMGWSHGGSTTLASMALNDNIVTVPAEGGFIMAIAEYPGCGLLSYFGTDHSNINTLNRSNFLTYAPTWILAGGGDTTTPPDPKCINLEAHAHDLAITAGRADQLDLTIYSGAEHGFDRSEIGKDNDQGDPWVQADFTARDDGRTFIEARFDEFLLSP